MKERPILFSGPMVRAILEGRKTMTRRMVKSPYKDENGKPSKGPFKWVSTESGFAGCLDLSGDGYDEDGRQMTFCCPHGHLGDRLYVRETFCMCNNTDEAKTICYRAEDNTCDAAKWTPSIHMPRAASRITLEVTGVKVERLQAMRGDDARREGFLPDSLDKDYRLSGEHIATAAFREYWDSINAKRPGCSWKENPWVFVIEFKKVPHDH